MSFQRQFLFWMTALVVVVLLLWLLSGVLLPFAAGIAIAYFLDPVADVLERWRFRRWIASLTILLAFLLVFVVAALLLVPLLGNQLAGFAERVPSYVSALQERIAALNEGWVGRLIGDRLPDIQRSLGDFVGQGASFVATFLRSLWSGSQAIVGVISVIVVTPVVAYYMLVDWDRMIAKVDSWVPRQHVGTVRGLAREIDQAIAGFVRGQALVCVSLGSFYAVGLSLTGLNFGTLIGLGAGLISFIPYVGSITGFVVGMGVAIVQFGADWQMLGLIVGVFAVGQFLEGNILSPRLVGGSVGLHPVWLMFALLAAGALFGFVGLLVAVPVAAAVGVLTRFALRRYLVSPLYTGLPRTPILPATQVEALADLRLGG